MAKPRQSDCSRADEKVGFDVTVVLVLIGVIALAIVVGLLVT